MFSHRVPAHLLPQLEQAILGVLQGNVGGEWEVVILPAAHLDTYLLTGEGDETPTIHGDDNDGA